MSIKLPPATTSASSTRATAPTTSTSAAKTTTSSDPQPPVDTFTTATDMTPGFVLGMVNKVLLEAAKAKRKEIMDNIR